MIFVFMLAESQYKYIINLNNYLIPIIAVVLTLLAGFRAIGVSQDDFNYAYMFDSVYYYEDWFRSRNELMAVVIPVTLKNFGIYSYATVFLTFSALGVSLKLTAIKKYSTNFYFSLLFYYSYFFFLHEMTQIRAGVAIGILMFTITDIYKRNIYKFIGKVLIASTFHISSLIFLPMYFLNSKKINVKVYLSVLIITFFIGVTRAVNVFTIIPGFSSMNQKLTAYQTLNSIFDEVNLLNSTNIFYLLVLTVLLIFHNQLSQVSKYAIINFKIFFFAVTSLFFFSSVPPLAWRISELFSVFIIFNVAYLIELIRPKYAISLFLIIIIFMLFNMNLFKQHIVNPYHSLLF
jgi:hypothetical protein